MKWKNKIFHSKDTFSKNDETILLQKNLEENYEYLVRIYEKLGRNWMCFKESKRLVVETENITNSLLNRIKRTGRKVNEYDTE